MKLLACTLLATALPAAAQNSIQRLVGAGDVTPIGAVTTIDNLALGDDGAWFVECDTNHANTAADGILLSAAGIVQRQGDPIAGPGITLGSFDALSVPRGGYRSQNLFLDGTAGSGDDSGVFWNDVMSIQEGDASLAPQFTPGTPYIGFFEVKGNLNRQILIVASVDDPAIATTVDRALVVASVDANGLLVSEDARYKEGDTLPGQTETVADFGTSPHEFDIDTSGSILYVADLNGLTTTDIAIYLDDTLLAQEGSPSPIAGRNWLSLGSSRLDMNDFGQWVFTGQLDGTTTDDQVIVSSSGKIAQEGDPVPGMPGFVFTGFGTGAVHIADNGDVFWYGEWNGVSTSNAAWFRNQTIFAMEGVTQVNGEVLSGIAAGQDNSSLAKHGFGFLFEGTLATSGNSALLADFTPQPVAYCTAKVNSQGCLPQIGWNGTPSASATSGFDVTCGNVINNKAGLLFYGLDGPASLPFQGGTLCVAAPVRRTPVIHSGGNPPPNDCSGLFVIDMNAFAHGLLGGQPDPALTVPGTRVNCQFWGRDPGFPAPDNTMLSDALEYFVGF